MAALDKVLGQGNGRGQDKTQTSLRHLDQKLVKAYLDGVRTIWQPSRQKDQTSALIQALQLVASAQTAIRLLYVNESEFNRPLRQQIQTLATEMTSALAAQLPDHHLACRVLVRTIEALNAADTALVAAEPDALVTKRVVVPAELLYQAYHHLFPAERMLVVSGRSERETTCLGVAFEVTGVNSLGHVKADPNRLAFALIAMDRSDCFLSAWLHSHPGRGAISTYPSATDLAQHADWIRDYTTSLISAILVEDGWIRFFGTALDEHEIEINVTGSGVTREENNGYLYRLVSG